MDTTAHTLAFAIYAMARNPSVQSKAHAEVDGLVEVEQSPDAASLPPYLEAVLKESMRKYPTASTGSMRQVYSGHVKNDVRILKFSINAIEGEHARRIRLNAGHPSPERCGTDLSLCSHALNAPFYSFVCVCRLVDQYSMLCSTQLKICLGGRC